MDLDISGHREIHPDQTLWRYMSLDKFICLLSAKTLYFSVITEFGESDPFEGAYPSNVLANLANQRRVMVAPLASFKNNVNHEREEFIFNYLASRFFIARNTAVVNCWHKNEYESESMWRIYSENTGVAIKTNARKLIECITDARKNDVKMNSVIYMDFEKCDPVHVQVSEENNYAPLFKRRCFEHEREVRLYYYLDLSFSEIEEKKNTNSMPRGIELDIDPDILIEEVYVSPYARETYEKSVRAIMKSFGYGDQKVKNSTLLAPSEQFKRLIFEK